MTQKEPMTLTRISHKPLTRWNAGGVAALSLFALASAKPAAAGPASGAPVIGSVDITKLQAGSTRKAKYDADLRALAERLDGAFKTQATNLMLDLADQTELGNLLSAPRPTEANRARITALEAKATQAFGEMTSLQQKKDPTPADTARLGALTDLNNSGQKIVTDIGAGYQTRLKKLNDDDTAAFTQAVKDAITATAQQRGLTVVFTSDVAVYTTNDITDDVIKRINK